MQTRLTLRPGDRGTKKLLAQYGDRLVCVRYRYDEKTGKRIKTAKLIIDETDEAPVDTSIPPCERRFITVGLDEKELREKVKNAGGRWHPDEVAWSLPYGRIVSLGLAARMIAGTVPAGFGSRQEYAHVDAL
jgi:hypothetical protein